MCAKPMFALACIMQNLFCGCDNMITRRRALIFDYYKKKGEEMGDNSEEIVNFAVAK